MSLGLLAPAALALAALLAGPILAHMARQQPGQEQEFGAMMLLRRLLKRLERRRRIRDLLLLALRLLVVALAVFAAARPRLSWPGDAPELGGSGNVVIVIDDSMSMGLVEGSTNLGSRAREQALALVESLPSSSKVGLVRAGAPAERVTPSLSGDRAGVLTALAQVQPGYASTDLAGALREARALLQGQPGEVVVFTDEAGPEGVAQAMGELRRLVEQGSVVIPRPVHADPPRNVAILAAAYGDGLEGGSVTVELASYGPEPVEVPVTVSLPDGSEITAFQTLEPEGMAQVRVTVPRTVPGGVARVSVGDGALSADDARYFHLPRIGASRVLVVDGDPGSTAIRSEVYFLERALAPWGGTRGGVLPEVVSPAGLGSLDPQLHRVVFLANVADPGPWSDKLVDFVRGGGGLVISAGSNMTAARTNGPLRDLLPAEIDSPANLAGAAGEAGAPLQLPDEEHPLFRPFTKAGLGDFRSVGALRVMKLEPFEEGDGKDERPQVLLRWSGGLPALLTRKVGQGRVVLWTSTLDLDWTNLPLQSVYMPLVQRLVGWMGGEAGGGALRAEGLVGETVELKLPVGSLEPTVTGPDGQEIIAELGRDDEGLVVRFRPRVPGAWSVGLPGEPPMAFVAVNTPPAESDVRRGEGLGAAQGSIRPDLMERHLDLASFAAALALGFLAVQAAASMGGPR